ncbi:MAG: SDR family NAD(P)-dependent oxidoreductase [Myxococcota bacterium]|nr:SDR family NAD(P)-dependent oxidoreductase [Myxococcota bacterium]
MSFWTGKRVLVTGAAGFIGSHLCETLTQAGASVRALTHYSSRCDFGNLEYLSAANRQQLDIVRGDVTDEHMVRSVVEGCTHVFHLAALIGIPYSYLAPKHYAHVNVLGTLAVLEACKKVGVERLVHTSTSETYGSAQYTPIDEQHPLVGQSPYSASKIGADKIAESYFLSFGLPVATIRPFNTYGPRQSPRAIIPTICSQLLAGKREIVLGSLTPRRDLNYVTDTCAGFMKAAEDDRWVGRVTNVGTGKSISIGELAQLIISLSGRAATVTTKEERIRPEKSAVQELLCDATLARATGWSPQVSLEEGLSRVLEFMEAGAGRQGDTQRYWV